MLKEKAALSNEAERCVSLSLALPLSTTPTCTHARTHARTHTLAACTPYLVSHSRSFLSMYVRAECVCLLRVYNARLKRMPVQTCARGRYI